MDGSYIAGFVDGEGSFHVAFQKRPDLKFGWQAIPEFHISQNFTSCEVLEEIKNFLGCGYIKPNDAAGKRDKTLVYVVRDRNALLNKIIPFFREFPLRTAKRNDFETFREIVIMMDKSHHLTVSGFQKIARLAFKMNAGGKYRKIKIEAVLASNILRDYTLDTQVIG
ncbi:MAG: LAGLIDADG family homing endonuclease [Candidatus Omnitrophica bacterium]|nr:LAGLIDADG family homing endonuclease [Candidatus Omnitrophota bacterium]